jgi:hypothetical protein
MQRRADEQQENAEENEEEYEEDVQEDSCGESLGHQKKKEESGHIPSPTTFRLEAYWHLASMRQHSMPSPQSEVGWVGVDKRKVSGFRV